METCRIAGSVDLLDVCGYRPCNSDRENREEATDTLRVVLTWSSGHWFTGISAWAITCGMSMFILEDQRSSVLLLVGGVSIVDSYTSPFSQE